MSMVSYFVLYRYAKDLAIFRVNVSKICFIATGLVSLDLNVECGEFGDHGWMARRF